MKKQRVLTLVHRHLVPPTDTAGVDLASAPWKMEYDVIESLRARGHEVLPLGVQDDLGVVRSAIESWKPSIVFNLLESFDDVTTFDMNVVSYLELMRVPYTGCNPRGLLIARDKALSKQLLAYHRVPFPEFIVFRRNKAIRIPPHMKFPVIVKSLTYEASVGISQASVVNDVDKLRKRVEFIHESVGSDAIAERYIDGRELYVGVLGNDRIHVFPVWEMTFEGMIEGDNWPIATERVKWNPKYQKKHGIQTNAAQHLPEGAIDQIQRLVRRIYRTLALTGYARVDLRMDVNGSVFFLEANPNPQLAHGEDFAESAERSGLKYEALLERILALGLAWRPGTV